MGVGFWGRGCFSDSPWAVMRHGMSRTFLFFLQFKVFSRFFLSLLPVIAILGGSF
jgi:hypothetical protein